MLKMEEIMKEETPWHTENWYEEDLINALEDAEIPITRENIDAFKQRCLHIFDDKSVRNEMLSCEAESFARELK